MSNKNRQTSKRVKEMQAAAKKAEQRRRNLIVGAIAVVVIVVVVGIGILVQNNRDETGSGSTTPAGVTDTYGVVRGDDAAPVTVTIYEDFQCPFCKEFEATLGDTLSKNVDGGTVKVDYRPIAFLDRASTTDYSSRALETAACTLDDAGVDAFLSLHDLLFANQPDEGTAGISDGELAGLAEQSGASKSAVESCQADDTFEGWVKAATDQASKDGVNSTPTYLVDGEKVDLTDLAGAPQQLQDAIDAAAGN